MDEMSCNPPRRGQGRPSYCRTAYSLGLLLTGFLTLTPAPFANEALVVIRPPVVERAESDMMLLAVLLDHTILSDAMTVYSNDGDVVVPLGELSALLSLAIKVDTERGVAEGFVISEERHFLLDLAAGRVRVEGREAGFAPSQVELHPEDIFVETRLLARWLPLDFVMDPYSATLTVIPREPLPLQLRLERQRQMAKTLAYLGLDDPKYPRIDNTYRLWDVPFLDQSVFVTSRSNPTGRRLSQARYSTLVSGDLLYMETNLHLRGDDRQPVTYHRLSMGRADPAATLLGPLKARQVGLIEIYYPGLDLVARPYSGPGVIVSNFPLNRPSQFDRHSFRGDVPPNWDVELYLNDALIAYQRSGLEGAYDFQDVPLLFGLNTFRLVFYGPQGQRREETQVFNVGKSMTPPGNFHYRLAGNDPEEAQRRYSSEFDLGLTRHVSASFSLASVGLADGQHQYGRLGSRLSWKRLFASADLAVERNQGSVWQAGLQTRVGPVALHVQHAEVNNYTSEIFQSTPGSLRGRSTATVDATIRPGFLPRVSMALETRRDRLEGSRTIDRIINRVSSSWRGIYCSNRTLWTFYRQPGQKDQRLTEGTFLTSKYWGRLAVRGELNYDLHPVKEVNSLTLSADGRLTPKYSFGVGIVRFSERQTRYLLSASKNAGAYRLGVRTSYSPDLGFGASLTFSVGLSRDPGSGRWFTQARSVASSGAASARVFLDLNANDVMDPGEAPLPGVGFLARAGPAAETDQNGIAFLTNLPSHQEINLNLSPGTLDDPLWIAGREGVCLVPRPGKVARIDFPVLATSEIVGTVYRREDGIERTVAGIKLELVDSERGELVKWVKSAYDGFYYISEIPPGRYILRVSPEQCSLLKLAAPTSRKLELTAEGDILDGVDFLLEPLGVPEN